jgi:opacity protein-like surface antigen
MLPRFLTVVVLAVALSAFVAGAAFAAPNPSGHGQPNQSCEEQPVGPAGFQSGGFENAESHYAGEGAASVNHAGSDKAVSQYDVACFQVSQ